MTLLPLLRRTLVQARYVPLFHFVDDVPALFEYLSRYEPHQLGLKPWASRRQGAPWHRPSQPAPTSTS